MKHFHVAEHQGMDGSVSHREYLFNLNKGFDLYLFQQATFTHSEYTSNFDEFLDDNNLLGFDAKGSIYVNIIAKGYNDVTGVITVHCFGKFRKNANETARLVLDYIAKESRKIKGEIAPKPKVISKNQKRRLAALNR